MPSDNTQPTLTPDTISETTGATYRDSVCPFCGKLGVHTSNKQSWRFHRYVAQCYFCAAQGPEAPSRAEALKAWHTRPAPVLPEG